MCPCQVRGELVRDAPRWHESESSRGASRDCERFGSASAVHKRFLEWEKAGVLEAIWKAGLAEYDLMEGGIKVPVQQDQCMVPS